MLAEFLLFACMSSGPPLSVNKPVYVPQKRINYLKKKLADNGVSAQESDALLADPRLQIPNPRIGKITWEGFQKTLFTPESIERGRIFLKKHERVLGAAEERFGIEKEYLVALIRVESDLGNNLGAFVSLRLFYERLSGQKWKKNADYFAKLAAYCRKEKIDCFSIKGSNQGAFGLIQFMPTSLDLAIDGNGDGKIDLFSPDDAIMSAANFLVEKGWHKNSRRALTRYYGSGAVYPQLVKKYKEAITKH